MDIPTVKAAFPHHVNAEAATYARSIVLRTRSYGNKTVCLTQSLTSLSRIFASPMPLLVVSTCANAIRLIQSVFTCSIPFWVCPFHLVASQRTLARSSLPSLTPPTRFLSLVIRNSSSCSITTCAMKSLSTVASQAHSASPFAAAVIFIVVKQKPQHAFVKPHYGIVAYSALAMLQAQAIGEQCGRHVPRQANYRAPGTRRARRQMGAAAASCEADVACVTPGVYAIIGAASALWHTRH